ncbi:MAG: hypothetical protein ACERKZ_06065 [Lachnotalea sp.]
MGKRDKRMYGVILEKGEKCYTYLAKVFTAINDVQKNYNWLITDCVCYPQTNKFEELLSKDYCWLSGEELTEIVEKEDFQWIWAVLSGFEKNIMLEDILKFPLPYIDGYVGFWKNPISIQHPLATVEIVPWDSSLTLMISKESKIVSDFKKTFPLSEDLAFYNER